MTMPRLVILCGCAALLGAAVALTRAGGDRLDANDGTPRQSAAGRASGDRVVVDWRDAAEAETEARGALPQADAWVVRIEELLFNRPLAEPERPIEIRFHGDARIGDPPRYRVPHVDGSGVVHLYRYGDSHLSALPHELVHAVLRREDVRYALFDEEGLAVYFAFVLRPSFPGFPAYGHPLDVIAGHWITSGNAIPLPTLRARHRELNLKCSFQAYAVRAAFFLDLGERFGADAMRAFIGRMGTDGGYESVFGATLPELESEWRRGVVAGFEARPNVDELVTSYLRQPAVANAYVCRPGRDF